jgi:hypothetical protein
MLFLVVSPRRGPEGRSNLVQTRQSFGRGSPTNKATGVCRHIYAHVEWGLSPLDLVAAPKAWRKSRLLTSSGCARAGGA